MCIYTVDRLMETDRLEVFLSHFFAFPIFQLVYTALIALLRVVITKEEKKGENNRGEEGRKGEKEREREKAADRPISNVLFCSTSQKIKEQC